MDIGDVKKAHQENEKSKSRRLWATSALRKTKKDPKGCIVVVCNKQGHIIREHRSMKTAKELKKQEFGKRSQGSKQD